MEVPGVEAVGDVPVPLVENGGLTLHRPVAREGPLVEPHPARGRVDAPLVDLGSTGGGEVLRTLVADVVLPGPQVVPVRGRLRALAVHRDQVLGNVLGSGFAQQLLDDRLRHLVVALSEEVVPDDAPGIDEVEGRPVVVGEGIPGRVVVVDRDRILDGHLPRGAADVVEVPLERELGRVHPDHHEPLIPVLPGPGADVGQGAQPVDAGVGPELDQDRLPAQALRRQRRRVEPGGGAVERRQVAFPRKLERSGRHVRDLSVVAMTAGHARGPSPPVPAPVPTAPARRSSSVAVRGPGTADAARGRPSLRSALWITSVTASRCEIMITCEPSSSTISAPARCAMERTTSLPAALSPVATTAQHGRFFHAGGPDGSVKAAAATGRWVAAITAVCSGGRSAANVSRNRAGSMANSTAGSAPCPSGYWSCIRAVFRTLSVEPFSISISCSPSSGANPET